MRIAVSGGRLEARAAGPPREQGAEGIASPSVRLGSSYPKVGLRLSTYLPAWCREDMAARKAARARLESGSGSAGAGRAPGSAPLASYQQLRAAGGGSTPIGSAVLSSECGKAAQRKGACRVLESNAAESYEAPPSFASPRPSGAICAPHVGRGKGGREGQISDRSVTLGLGWFWHCPYACVWKRRVGAACR